MGLKIAYDSEFRKNAPLHAEVHMRDDVNLRQAFLAFVDMTRIAGYSPESWAKILDDGYDLCVIHANSREDYNIYDWVVDGVDADW